MVLMRNDQLETMNIHKVGFRLDKADSGASVALCSACGSRLKIINECQTGKMLHV